ncbi:hypothetical protein BDN71DRAFT_1447489 [Pleurotus eryngii]|uniref:Uncharacterized protein n=1 Tax=Pleurotus eryngii TaxID=5323 RepID=A0A9P5ZYQ6_PLEER|nr:hypothetical protein BDN71DRAFT_1447489 [Pleurotus eryngii]
MRAFSNVLAIAALAVAVSAANLPAAVNRMAVNAGCNDAKITHTSHVLVGNKQVTRTGLSCTLKGMAAREPSEGTVATDPVHVCGQSCTTSCSSVSGILPPISEDCGVIVSAIEIFKNQGPTSFVAQPQTMETLTFGTCSYLFVNFSNGRLEYCWDDMAITCATAGAACFPPHQPFSPQGWCTGSGGLWAAGASHS